MKWVFLIHNEVNESYVFQPVPIGKNPIGIGYYICKICDRIIETPFVLIYNKDNIMILLQHSKSIRNMVVKYMKSMNSKSERYKDWGRWSKLIFFIKGEQADFKPYMGKTDQRWKINSRIQGRLSNHQCKNQKWNAIYYRHKPSSK